MLGVEREPSHMAAIATAASKVTLVPSFGFPQFKKTRYNGLLKSKCIHRNICSPPNLTQALYHLSLKLNKLG